MKHIHFIIFFGVLIMSCNSKNHNSEITATVSEKLNEPRKIQFLSLDSLIVTANLYDRGNEFPVILLCHQAGFNKIEYTEIAKTLYNKGFNCLAIDQRSGGNILESFNETLLEANKKSLPVEFLDAEQDIIAAIDYTVKKYNKDVILWGSSYSATLALYIASDHKNVKAVIAFSPGNYFDEQKGGLKDKLKQLKKPFFITSSKKEANDISTIIDTAHIGVHQIHFIPSSEGNHGSRALWKTDKNNEEYWAAINQFLNDMDK